MNAFAEEPFVIGGVKSWIHCLRYHVSDPITHNSRRYHYHDYIEFLYGTMPGANVWISGVCHPLGEGDLVIINSGDYHTVTFDSEAEYICVKFSPGILYADEQALLELKYLIPFISQTPLPKFFTKEQLRGTKIQSLTKEIMREWEKKGTAYELVIRADILKIFAAVFRYWCKNDLTIPHVQATETMKKALAHISENLTTVTEQSTAEVCGLSYHYFSAAFRKWTGQSFLDYVQILRIHEAEKLLISTEESVTDIALATGFSSASHFISLFKKHKKITPKQFRKKLTVPQQIFSEDKS